MILQLQAGLYADLVGSRNEWTMLTLTGEPPVQTLSAQVVLNNDLRLNAAMDREG